MRLAPLIFVTWLVGCQDQEGADRQCRIDRDVAIARLGTAVVELESCREAVGRSAAWLKEERR